MRLAKRYGAGGPVYLTAVIAVLGFVGMPTLGFALQSSFAQGYYSEVGALLLVFFVLIATWRPQWRFPVPLQ